jgi:hypothetical protein
VLLLLLLATHLVWTEVSEKLPSVCKLSNAVKVLLVPSSHQAKANIKLLL